MFSCGRTRITKGSKWGSLTYNYDDGSYLTGQTYLIENDNKNAKKYICNKDKMSAYLPAVLGLHVQGVETPVGERDLDEVGGSKKCSRYNLAPVIILITTKLS